METLHHLFHILRDNRCSDDVIMTSLAEAYQIHHDDSLSLNLIGQKCRESGFNEQAEFFFREALCDDTNNPLIKENLRDLYERLINRWHFTMLNDVTRNSLYFKSIKEATHDDTTVLDIGSGTGILSMMAVRSGAKHVYACDLSHVMVRMSHDILVANQIQDKISVIHSSSHQLKVPETLPEQVSLVVTETVDAGLLGEMIIPTLRHAWKELLISPTNDSTNQITPAIDSTNQITPTNQIARVIPCAATVYVCAIECNEIRKQTRLLSNDIGGIIDTGCIHIVGTCNNDTDSNLTHEPYTCEDLSLIRGGVKLLSHPVPCLAFDFTNPEIPLPFNILSLPVIKSGTVDAIVTWFDLHLDSKHTISSSPSSGTSWEQAVYPLETPHPLNVTEGELVSIQASCSDTEIKMHVMNDGCHSNTSHLISDHQSGNDSQPLDPTNVPVIKPLHPTNVPVMKPLHPTNVPVIKPLDPTNVPVIKPLDPTNVPVIKPLDPTNVPVIKPLYYVERSHLLKLNDEVYNSIYTTTINEAIVCVTEEEEEDETVECTVLDLTQDISIFGLVASLMRADFVLLSGLQGCYNSLISSLCDHNSISDKVFINDIVEFSTAQWDIVILDVVSPQGTLQSQTLMSLQYIQMLSDINFVPYSMNIIIMGVASPAMRAHSSVLGKIPTIGFDIASFLNKYQISHYTDVDLCTFPHEGVTSATPLFSLNFSESLTVVKDVTMEITNDNVITGIAYWFVLHFHGNKSLSTGPNAYEGSHWHQSVFMLSEDITVKRGQILTITGRLQYGCLDIVLKEIN